MRKYTIVVLVLALGFIAKEGFTWKNGAPPGRSGSLGDGANTCASPYCHSGPEVTDEVLSVQVPIALDGYTLGDTLDVLVEMTKIGGQRFGFELAAENEMGQKVGKFLPVAGATKLTGGNITHVGTSIDALDAKVWAFEWVAPTTAEGAVTFSLAGNFANKNDMASGDVIATTQHTIPQSTMAISENNNLEVNIFPIPASNYINVKGAFTNATVSIYSLSGALLVFDREISQRIDVSKLPIGTYVMKVESNGKVAREVISIAR